MSHSYGPTCRLATNAVPKGDDVPALKSQFFYCSPLPIDDPLSVIPTPSGSESKSIRHPLRPFSAYDNDALEEAWLEFSHGKVREHDKNNRKDGKRSRWDEGGQASGNTKAGKDKQASQSINESPVPKGSLKGSKAGKDSSPSAPEQGGESKDSGASQKRSATTPRPNIPLSQGDSVDEWLLSKHLEGPREAGNKGPRSSTEHDPSKGHQSLERHPERGYAGSHADASSSGSGVEIPERLGTSTTKQRAIPSSTSQPSKPLSSSLPDQEEDAGITGKPFVKLPSRRSSPRRASLSIHDNGRRPSIGQFTGDSTNDLQEIADGAETEVVDPHSCKAHQNTDDNLDVPVGISRLHLVKVPALQMLPIYWSPVHDESNCQRGTWFYHDTMYPVEPAVANQLESGYRDLRCWSETWNDELKSAMEVGALGEEKIAHRLWPIDNDTKNKSLKPSDVHISTDPYCAARCFRGEAAAEGSIDIDGKPVPQKVVTKKYSTAQVIYKDFEHAFILKPTLQPSAYYGRKPLQKISRGMTVGIHVIRGFDWKSWNKLHPSKKSRSTVKAEENAPVAGDSNSAKPNSCPACRSQEEPPKVSDLCLVVHGIGQKLSERVESFHFTHAMNAFRRSVTAELGNDAVQKVLREDLGGIMVLPVNWRSGLTFDGDSGKDGNENRPEIDFSLTDITQPTIPAVRAMISDVMLDIPFYMSHHKPKMIQAVVSEANRVYRLWCKNNPEFHLEGRVHVIAHSLGSVMTLEILSKQPTSVSNINFNSNVLNTTSFDFNTSNLFFCGSPAGFFCYLEKARLTPRRGKGKPGAQYSDIHDKKITGEAGTYGCLALENCYNIMAINDPISYRLNAAVDRQYACSLRNAQVPSATTGFFESIGNAMRSITPGASSAEHRIGQVPTPGNVPRLPSQMELAVHDFTREELAEKKMHLLNDNGQVDWFLSTGGGPLEIQYINMLGAHSSYWTSPDFVRMIVTEVGRKPGRAFTLPNMRARKAGHKPS